MWRTVVSKGILPPRLRSGSGWQQKLRSGWQVPAWRGRRRSRLRRYNV